MRKELIGTTSKLLVGTLLVGGFLVLQVPASQPATHVAIVEQTPAEPTTINGTVKAVSDATVTVVDDKKAEHSIGLDSNTKIMKAGKEATVADLKANDAVSVVAKKNESGVLTAVMINIA